MPIIAKLTNANGPKLQGPKWLYLQLFLFEMYMKSTFPPSLPYQSGVGGGSVLAQPFEEPILAIDKLGVKPII